MSFERAIQARLRCRIQKSVIFVDFDVFRHVFGAENTMLCNLDDFKKLSLSDYWVLCVEERWERTEN